MALIALPMEMARHAALNTGVEIVPGPPTEGDGKCFYHAICDTLQHHYGHVTTASNMRYRVVQYIKTHRHLEFITTFEAQAFLTDEDRRRNGKNLDDCLQRHLQGSYASELFITATAMMLQLTIIMSLETSTPVHPFQIQYPFELKVDPEIFVANIFVMIAHITNPEHFQALYYPADLDWKSFMALVAKNKRHFLKRPSSDPNVAISSKRKVTDIPLLDHDYCYISYAEIVLKSSNAHAKTSGTKVVGDSGYISNDALFSYSSKKPESEYNATSFPKVEQHYSHNSKTADKNGNVSNDSDIHFAVDQSISGYSVYTDANHVNVETELENECRKYSLLYMPPFKGESAAQKYSRTSNMRKQSS